MVASDDSTSLSLDSVDEDVQELIEDESVVREDGLEVADPPSHRSLKSRDSLRDDADNVDIDDIDVEDSDKIDDQLSEGHESEEETF